MKHVTLKGMLSAAMAVCTMSVAAQVPSAVVKPAFHPETVAGKQALRTGATVVKTPNGQAVRLAAPRLRSAGEAVSAYNVMKRDTPVKPGAFYKVESGYYNLVPGFALASISEDSVVYANHGVLGYPDRDIHFINATPEGTYSAIEWDFSGDKFLEDTVMMHPFFANNNVFLDTPKLTATSDGVDSTYQMGYGSDNNYDGKDGRNAPGMVSLSQLAYVYNVDVDATPFYNTFYSALGASAPWTRGNMLFGWDPDLQSSFVEMFEAPKDGAVALWGTHFFVLTPSSVDLAKKRFAVTWAEWDEESQEWVMRKEFTDIKPELERGYQLGNNLRVWSVSVNTEQPDCLVENEFYVMITGPQDGTQWSLFSQLDRMDFPNPERNTAYYVPAKGDYQGQLCQYVLQLTSGEEWVYASSLDIHQFVVTPYMIMCKDDASMAFMQDKNYDFDVNGEEQKYLIIDWMGSAENGTSIKAEVSNSTDGDWLAVTQPTVSEVQKNYFSISFTASAKPWNGKGRRATVTLTDHKGFSRELVMYQGDRAEADNALSVETVNAAGKVEVAQQGEDYRVAYPTSYDRVNVYDASGRMVAEQALTDVGSAVVHAASWRGGIYLMQFSGRAGMQTVKVVK